MKEVKTDKEIWESKFGNTNAISQFKTHPGPPIKKKSRDQLMISENTKSLSVLQEELNELKNEVNALKKQIKFTYHQSRQTLNTVNKQKESQNQIDEPDTRQKTSD